MTLIREHLFIYLFICISQLMRKIEVPRILPYVLIHSSFIFQTYITTKFHKKKKDNLIKFNFK